MKYNFDEIIDRRGTNAMKWSVPAQSDIIPLWVADMDFRVAQPIADALQRRIDHGIFGYTKVPDAYYEATINWFHRRHQWNIAREWIQYTTGVVPALSAIIKGLTSPGDKVVVQTPVFNCFFSSIRNNGCQIVENALRRQGDTYVMDYDELDRLTRDPLCKLFLLCNPHNPAGRVWTGQELERAGEICRKNSTIVVSDEIHCELAMPGYAYTPMASISPSAQDNCITCVSPSKSFNIAGLHMANIVSNNATWRKKIDRAININETCDLNPFGIEALIAAYNEGEEWLEQLLQYINGNYLILKSFIDNNLPELQVMRLEGTYLAWIDIKATGKTSDELTNTLLDHARVWVNSGTLYGQKDGEGYIRINLATPRANIEEALHRMTPILRELL